MIELEEALKISDEWEDAEWEYTKLLNEEINRIVGTRLDYTNIDGQLIREIATNNIDEKVKNRYHTAHKEIQKLKIKRNYEAQEVLKPYYESATKMHEVNTNFYNRTLDPSGR